MKLVWLDCLHFCGGVVVNKNNIICEAPPICRKFLGQNFDVFLRWLLHKNLLRAWKVIPKLPRRQKRSWTNT